MTKLRPYLFLFLPLLLTLSVQQTFGYAVLDRAKVLTLAETEHVISALATLSKDKNISMVVLLEKSLGGRPIEAVAEEEFRKAGIGEKKTDNGLLLLIAIDDHKMRLEVGYGLEGDIPDVNAKRMLDQTLAPYLKQQQLALGVLAMIQRVYEGDYAVTPNATAAEKETSLDMPPALAGGICLASALFFFIFIAILRYSKATSVAEIKKVCGDYVPSNLPKYKIKIERAPKAMNLCFRIYPIPALIFSALPFAAAAFGSTVTMIFLLSLVALTVFSFGVIGVMFALRPNYPWTDLYREAPADLKPKVKAKLLRLGYEYIAATDSFVLRRSTTDGDGSSSSGSSSSSSSSDSSDSGGRSGGGGASSSW